MGRIALCAACTAAQARPKLAHPPGAPVADRQVPRRCLASVVGITINLFPGEYTASSRLIPSRVTRSQAADPEAGVDRGPGMRLLSRLNVRFGPDYVRLSPSNRHSGKGWECLKLTHNGSRGSPIRDPLSEGFSHFVTSMTAPIASGRSDSCRVGLAPTGKAPPYHGAPPNQTFRPGSLEQAVVSSENLKYG